MGVTTHSYALQPDDLLSAKIQSLCPTISGNVCCTEAQFDTLRAQVQQVRPHHLHSHTHTNMCICVYMYI